MQIALRPQINMLALTRRIQPQASEIRVAGGHFGTVRSRLLASFNVVRTPRIGSHARGTAIRWHSDLDVLAVLRGNEAKWGERIVYSGTLLSRVVGDLQGRFPHTSIRGDQQAAAIGFAAGQQNLDVVPALWGRFFGKRPVYDIPDGDGGWLETSPENHTQRFQLADQRSGGKLKRVCQLLRWWKYSRTTPIPLQSFHADVLLAESDTCVGAKTYPQCLYFAFKLLSRRKCAAIRDPAGISGNIAAAKTSRQRDALLDAVEYALQHAESALVCESAGKLRQANEQWDLVFNGGF